MKVFYLVDNKLQSVKPGASKPTTAIAVTAVINLVEGGRREEEVCLDQLSLHSYLIL